MYDRILSEYFQGSEYKVKIIISSVLWTFGENKKDAGTAFSLNRFARYTSSPSIVFIDDC